MNKIVKCATDLIGNTPLLEVERLEKMYHSKARVYAKLEYLNPAGSVKDRVALHMIEEAEQQGRLHPGATIIEPTSGNTGIGLAHVAAARGYHAILVLPDTMSVERQTLLKAYGAEVVLTDGMKGMQGSIEKAEELHRAIEHSMILGQFTNKDNPATHKETTGPEIWDALDGKVDVLVCGVGTGGTITGTGEYLKSKNPRMRVVAVEPAGSPLLSGGKAGTHGLQGIGANFIPVILNLDIYDSVRTVTDEDAYEMGRMIAHKEGILVGITSGASMWAAMELAKQEAYEDKNIVVILPDSGDRYLSTPMFSI